jgi:COX assembly protein 2
MHPQLSDKKLVCQDFIKALEACHSDGWSRYTGACNRLKDELNSCLHSESLKRSAANREAAKARKAKAQQASKAFYEE